ncbi:DUF2235 domain-containing protein [Vibrio hannami]|uniref:DUF2235 domain-containing protein n=1 Tax=Vibrio hannami TaxID=2717094 RepID=UPI00240F04B6|nr:DUF2235 domain-containing protein [Vibrio hannami]MDG3087817.1 DUF2235 domain-containing protein [Vibrio hannami]
MANLLVCCDGTWNAEDNKDNGEPVPTNVRQIFNCLQAIPGEQETRYQSGVGTGGIFDKVLGGALGIGISEDIRDCYQWLSDKYRSGDRIFLFGFSRGAFSARSLAGMICRYGLADFSVCDATEREEVVSEIYSKGYREKGSREMLLSLDMNIRFYPDSDKVFFIGVWDTVGALGIPDDKALLDLFDDPKHYAFHDTTLSPSVSFARQALAIDERRGSFAPTLWEKDSNNTTSDLLQKWFPGVHSDVGGGYKQNGLSDGALMWMIEELQKAAPDINWNENLIKQIKPDYQALLHDSHIGVMKALITVPRTIPNIRSREDEYHVSALLRHDDPPREQGQYLNIRTLLPGEKLVIDIYARHQYNWIGIYLEAGKEYRFSAEGAWADSTIACGPKGEGGEAFNAQEILRTFGTLIGKVENTVFHELLGRENANFVGSKRHDEYPWFCLVGAIANGANPKLDGTVASMESFMIGEHNTHKVEKSGYLYCYANDAWAFYANNRGYLTLTIEEVG